MTETIAEDVDVATSTEEDETDELDLGKDEQKHRFVVLRAKGYSYARIVRELGVSKGTLTAWNAELEAEIAKARAMELEALQEEFFLLKEGRIRLIGEQLKAIQIEIGKRDLAKVNTDKLLELQLRYFGELKGEYVETGQRTRTGPKLNTSDISEELQSVLERYRAGEISEPQAKLEQAVLQSMLKAIEQTELAAKLERLEAVIRSRR
ncbi:MAG: transposase [Phycisphaerae bacterium]|nr:transposase [Phycisphaerae bacterium]